MLVAIDHGSDVTLSGALEEIAFTVEMNHALFDLLSGLYKDMLLATVREPITNSLDGYTALKRERPDAPILPPRITVPSQMNPFFRIEDFGAGMSPETVRNVYVGYTKSTKNTSDEEIGGFGIGAKAPFAYPGAKQWHVESRWGGRKQTYLAFKNEDGLPRLVLMEDIAYDGPTGVTVTVPIPVADHWRAQLKIQQVLAYFPMDVEIIGAGADFKIEKPEYVLRGTNWGVRKAQYAGTHHIVMGNYAYPVSQGELIGWAPEVPTEFWSRFSLDFFVPVGAVTIPPSREGIKGSDRTAKTVEQLGTQLVAEFPDTLTRKIKKADTHWEALTIIHEMGVVASLKEKLTNVRWNGIKLDLSRGLKLDFYRSLPPAAEVRGFENSGRTINTRVAWGDYITPGQHIYVAIADVENDPAGKIAERRFRHFLKTTAGKQGRSSARYNVRGYLVFPAALRFDEVRHALGGIPLSLASTMEEPPEVERRKYQSREKTRVKVWVYGGSYDDVDLDPNEDRTFFYVRMERKDLMDHRAWEVEKMLELSRELRLFPRYEQLYVLPRTHKHLEAKKNWVEFGDHLKRLVEAECRKDAEAVKLREDVVKTLGVGSENFFRRADLSTLPERSLARRIQAVVQAMPDAAVAETLKRLVQLTGTEVGEAKPSVPISPLAERFHARYPMAKYLLSRQHSFPEGELNDLTSYITQG